MTQDLHFWCQQRYRKRYRRLRVLPVPGDDWALWLDDGRVRAVVGTSLPKIGFLGMQLALVRELGGDPRWYMHAAKGWEHLSEDSAFELMDAADVGPDDALRRMVVLAIHWDHERQLAGDLLAGFVKRLDQQFSRAELYLFELLQNAVDEGARKVSFELRDDTLVFQHDGDAFNASDILGLSSVGASGKTGRTIGFMGLGFKAVYSRFAHVTLNGGGWRVGFERPQDETVGGWKFLPHWCADAPEPDPGFTCRFDFGRAHGGIEAIAKDLDKIEDVVTVLLARRTLLEAGAKWVLNWNGRTLEVARDPDGPMSVERFTLSEAGAQRRWIFLGTKWSPSHEAVRAWRDFREEPDGDPGEQELSLFAELSEDGNLVEKCKPGVVHAVLPTKEELPLGFDLQANWLLRADRQGAMSARDNAWNADIVLQLPKLVVRLLQWIAHGDGPPSVEESYRRLPSLKTYAGLPCLSILDISVDFTSVIDALLTEALVPCLGQAQGSSAVTSTPNEGSARDIEIARRKFARFDHSTYQYEFVTASNCRRIPNALLSDLSPEFVKSWLGGLSPFAFRDDEEESAFFRSAGVIGDVSESEWMATADVYESILKAQASDRIRAWGSIQVAAAVIRARKDKALPARAPAVIPNGNWKPCAAEDLTIPPRQFLFLSDSARTVLVSDFQKIPAIPMLQVLASPQSSNEIDLENAKIVAEDLWRGSRDLRDLTGPFFEREAIDAPGWELDPISHVRAVVAVTLAIRKLNTGHDAVTHVLSVANGSLKLRRKDLVWVGAAYGFPQVEVAAGGRLPFVSSDYGNEPEWGPFFASACQVNPTPVWKLVASLAHWDHQAIGSYIEATPKYAGTYASLNLPMGLGAGGRDRIFVFSTSLEPWDQILRESRFDLVRARSFAALIAQGRYSPVPSSSRLFSPLEVYVSWVADKYSRGYAASPGRLPNWLEALRDNAWVPTNCGSVARPRDVLLYRDPHNPDAPVADLDELTRAGLQPLAHVVRFGAAVTRPGPLEVLLRAAGRPETTPETLHALWLEVLADGTTDLTFLRERASGIDLIPVRFARRDGKLRVSSSRLVKVGNFDFGGFLCPVADTLLSDNVERLNDVLLVAERPTADQAVEYLEWVWANQPSDVEDAVVSAWRTVLADPDAWPKIRACREAGLMKLFCRPPGARRGDWLPIPSSFPHEMIWGDAPSKISCLRPADGLWLEAWLIRRASDLNVAALLSLTGLGRLSDERFRLAVKSSGSEAMPEETIRLGMLISAVEAIHEGEQLLPNDLVLRRAQWIDRTFQIGDGAERAERIDASWDGRQTMHVVGRRSAAWATDLRPLVQQALGLGSNARALRLLDLIPLLDDEENFDRKFDQLCYELEVPGEETKDERSFLPRSRETEQVRGDDDAEAAGSDEDNVDADDPEAAEFDEDLPASDTDGSVKRKSGDSSRRGTDGDNGSGSGTGGLSSPTPGDRKPRGSGSWDPGVAPNRFLIQPQGTDEGDADNGREQKLPKDDEAGRKAVMDFERKSGRDPTEANRFQRGYDVSSQDGEVIRKIEVKGLQGAWRDQASVSMTGAQFDDARSTEGDWWLYVVEYAGSSRANVIAIPNPAKGTRAFYLYACHWRPKAVAPAPRPLLLPDEDDDD